MIMAKSAVILWSFSFLFGASFASEESLECFDPEILNGEKNSFLNFEILGPELVSISWYELWQEADWELCLYDVQIVANIGREDEMAIEIRDPFTQKSLNTSVIPCMENTYVLKAIHEPSDTTLISLGKARPIKTIKSLDLLPEPKNGIQASYDEGQIIYAIQPNQVFSNLPGDCTARRTFTILTRPRSGEQTWSQLSVEHSEQEAEIDIKLDLSDLKENEECQIYDVKLNVNEQGHEVELYLSPIHPYKLIQSGSLDTNMVYAPRASAQITDVDSTSARINIDEKSVPCSTSYSLTFHNSDLPDKESVEHNILLSDLSPCSVYEVELKAIMGKDEALNGTILTFRTSPELPVARLDLSTLEIQMHDNNQVIITWDAKEYPCLIPDDYKVQVSEVSNTAEENSFSLLRNGSINEEGSVYFKTGALAKCADYKLHITSASLGHASPLERKFRTGGEKTQIQGVKVINATATTVTLNWTPDPCAKGYQVTNSRILKGAKRKFVENEDDEDYSEGSGYESSTDALYENDSEEGGSGYESQAPSFDFKGGRMVFESNITIRTLEPCSKYFIIVRGYYAESQLGDLESDYGPSSVLEYPVPCAKSINDYVSTTIKNIEELLAGKTILPRTEKPLINNYDDDTIISTTTMDPSEIDSEPVTHPNDATLRTIYMPDETTTRSEWEDAYEDQTEDFSESTTADEISEYVANFAKSSDDGTSKTSDYFATSTIIPPATTEDNTGDTTTSTVITENPDDILSTTKQFISTTESTEMATFTPTDTTTFTPTDTTTFTPTDTTNFTPTDTTTFVTTTEQASSSTTPVDIQTSTMTDTTTETTMHETTQSTRMEVTTYTTTETDVQTTTTEAMDESTTYSTTDSVFQTTTDSSAEFTAHTTTDMPPTTDPYDESTTDFTTENYLDTTTDMQMESTTFIPEGVESTTHVSTTEVPSTTVEDDVYTSTTESFSTSTIYDDDTTTLLSTTYVPTALPPTSTLPPTTTMEPPTTTPLETTTTTTVPPSTTTMEPLVPIQNVIYNFSDGKDSSMALSIHWAQARTIHSELRLNDEMISSHEASSNSESDYNTIQTNTEVKGCQKYSLELRNHETREVYWEVSETTPLNEYEVIQLNELVMDESTGSLEWNISPHYETCLTGFDIVVNDKILIEIPLSTSSVSTFEHLKNVTECQDVTLNFIPRLNDHKYLSAGYKSSFKYKPLKDTEIFNITEEGMSVVLGNKVHCEDGRLTWKNMRTMDTISSKSLTWPIFEINNLESCTVYEVVVYSGKSDESEPFITTVKTLSGNHSELKDDEVTVENGEEEKTLTISWVDQCRSSYALEICPLTRDCSNMDNYESINSDSPSVIIKDIKGCLTYSYNIRAEGTLLYNGSLSVSGNPDSIQRDPSLFHFKIDEGNLNLDWVHVWPCVKEYEILIFEDDVKGELRFQELLPSTCNISFQHNLSNEFVNCKSYLLEVKTRSEGNVLFSQSFKYFNGLYTPLDGLHHTILDSKIVFEWNKPSFCGVQSYVAEILDFHSKSILFSYNNTPEEVFSIDSSSLKPCTRYHFRISYISEDGVLSETTSLQFTTRHPNFIPLNTTEGLDKIEVILGPLGDSTDCVDYYEVTLCQIESIQCFEKVMPLSSHESHISFVFNDLSSQTLYQYQVIGYNDKDVQIFIDAERQASTKSQIQSSSIKLVHVYDHKFILEVEYTLQTQENNPEYMVDVKCVDLRTDKIFERKTSVSQTLIFDGLAMGAKFICEGTLRIGEEVSSFGSIETHTLEGIPSSPIHIRASNVEPKEALVEWDVPLESNGVIGEYVISAKLICDSTELVGHCLKECESLAEDLEFSTSSNTLQLKDLTPFGEYALKVRARTSTRKEFGPWSKVFLLRMAPGDPFIPKILSLKGVSSSKIIVDFSYPCIVSGVTRFDVSALKSVQQKRRNHRAIKKRFEIGRKRFILEGLEGGHTYNIQVSARVDDCSSGKCLVRSEKSQVYLNCAFRCNDGSCINKKWDVRCDFIQDCMDGSDEKNCTCEPPHFFKCSNGYCLESWKQCDGKVDCNDMSDEAGCPGCPADQFQCKKSGKCVELKQTCDRKLDCPDGSDEHNCPYWKKSCWSDEFRCLDASCINSRFVCDGIWDCSGGEDERSCEKSTCSSTSEFTCKPRNPHFPNKESICIPLHKYCDGEKDCVDGSDETFGCECHRIGKFACASGDECTERLRVCDGTINCKDGSDEHDCRRYDNSSFIPSTTPSTTSTTTLSTTLPSSPNNIRHVYDDYEFYDYLESADQVMETPKEEKYPSGLKLRIYPEYQSISIGSDVVIMCRDESDHRHQVSWTRPKNLHMPEHYFDNGKGRLEIYKLKREEAGVYECKALKPLSPKTPLGVARAFVHMEYHP